MKDCLNISILAPFLEIRMDFFTKKWNLGVTTEDEFLPSLVIEKRYWITSP